MASCWITVARSARTAGRAAVGNGTLELLTAISRSFVRLTYGRLTPGRCMTIAVAGVALLITTIGGSLLTPMVMSRASSMNQVAIFGGLLFWSWMWGIWGMLLAVPMMMMIKVVCDHVEPLHPVGHLLGD